MNDNLDESFELINVAYVGRRGNRSLLSSIFHHYRRLDALSLPLCITVKGQANQSYFVLSSYVMEVLKDQKQYIVRKLKFLDWDTFKNVGLSTDTYYFAAIITEPIPGIKEMETIAHPVQMAFENVPAGHHHLSAVDRSTVLCFAKELI